MNEDLALELVDQVREEYEDSTIFGKEVDREVVENRHQESFEVLSQWLPVQYDWVEGDSLSDIHKIGMSSGISNIHKLERQFLIERLEEAENVPTVSLSEITHNNLVEALTEVFNPTTLYIPTSKPFLDVDSQRSIGSIVDSFSELERAHLNTDPENSMEALYAIRSDYIRITQCTRVPLDQSDWLPDRPIRDINGEISEHSLYCSYGSTNQIDADYVLAAASIPSSDPYIRDNAAVKISIDNLP
ncbi:hypothetical protein OB955_00010 [Halobacteria archaeon AArc-m2/3/4]|uniref:Uncharacterized protein n=1 Tax=Natronoglomus mannanivorans TaxID=2979990 RepID=A0ABT2Q863_9EURY|nr:hypothetical protein [Halobacteria archaeon AArc-m2/3/4]